MPTIEENRANWDDPARWQRDGDEWSSAWGGTKNLWFGSLLPRLFAYLPAGRLLEIACGHGRITEFLLRHCDRYTGVDLAPTCVEHCRRRFASEPRAHFALVDGRSLAGVDDASIDLVVSWDSLVHAERDAIDAYLPELRRVLRPGGVAWLHHSNLGAFVGADGRPSIPNPHWRASTVSAAHVAAVAAAAGAPCLSQELLQWGVPQTTDCVSVLRRPHDGQVAPPMRQRVHPDFGAEMAHFRALGELHSRP
jgi:SAM-dependent methyltransferase